MKNIYKIIILVFLNLYLFLSVNYANANSDIQNSLLVKTANSNIVYLIINNKKHKILNPEVFIDYGFNAKNIKTITEEQLKHYQSLKLAKIANNPKVYYIHDILNKKKWIPSAEIFLAYENKWEDIAIISQKDLDSYSDIQVIKSANSHKIYELKNGIKSGIANPQEFMSKGYRWNEVVIVKDIELDYYSTQPPTKNNEIIHNKVADNKKEQNSDILSTPDSANKFLTVKTVKLNKDLVAPSGSIIRLLDLQLTAGLGQPVNVNFLKISRAKGLSLIKNIIIADEKNNVFGNAEMLNENFVNIGLKPELYIAPGANKIIHISGSTKDQDYIVYEQLFIESEKDISTDGKIEGVFPLTGDRIKIIPGNKLIGKIEIGAVVVSDGLRNVYLGDTDNLITKFTFKETTGNENVDLKILKITNTGSSYVKLANVDLVDQDNRVIATVANPAGNSIIFDMTRSPYKIPKGLSRTLSIKTDIVDGAGGNIKFEIDNANDITATGKEYLFDLTVSAKENEFFPIGRGNGRYVNMVKINDVDVAVYKNDLSHVGGLAAGAKEQSLGIFNIRVNGSTINQTSITLRIDNSNKINKVDLAGDLIVRDYKTKKILGQTAVNAFNGGQSTMALDTYPKIEKKQTFAFEILGNIDDKATILDAYQIKITGIGFKIINSNLEHDLDCKADGNILSVKKSNLIITSDSALKDAEIAAGKTKVLIGSFILQAGVGEDIIINNFNISEAAGSSQLAYNNGYSDLKIQVNKKDYAIYEAPSGGQFIVNKPFTIKAGQSVSVAIYVDTTPLVDGKEIKLAISNVNAYGELSGLEPISTGSNSQSFITKFKQSRLAISKNTEMEDAKITAGKNDQKIASFRFENKGVENIAIKNFTLAETADSSEISYANGYSNLRTSNKLVVKKPIAGGNVFGGFTIKANDNIVVDIYVNADISTIKDQDQFTLVLKDIQVNGNVVIDGDYAMGQGVIVVGN